MKKYLLSSGLMLGLTVSAQAALYSWNSTTLSALIPDNSSAGPTFSGPATAGDWSPSLVSGTIASVDVRLNISGYNGGGYNGDLYAYLTYTMGGNSTSLILLNRVGRTGVSDAGYSASVLNLTLTGDTTQGYSDIHLVPSTVNTTKYLADARTTLSTGDFSTATRTPSAGLEFFNNSSLAANGTWSLFLADRAAGDQSQLVSWGLDLGITAVPEPVNVALGLFGVLFAGVTAVRWRLNWKADSA